MCLDWHGPHDTSRAGSRPERTGEASGRAITSRTTVERAIGVLIAVHGVTPTAGLEVLRDTARHTGTTLHAVAEAVIGQALGRALPEPVRRELHAAAQRHTQGNPPGRPA
ncbi:ANTAR domain-containing protein [Streptomyces longwoodensis]